MQLVNLQTLLPLLKSHQVLPESDLARVGDAKHHRTVERIGFLLQTLYKKADQETIDKFMQCLREETDHPGHQEIAALLEKDLSNQSSRSPFSATEPLLKNRLNLNT